MKKVSKQININTYASQIAKKILLWAENNKNEFRPHEHVKGRSYNFYLRLADRYLYVNGIGSRYRVLDLASIEFSENLRGKGLFTHILQELETAKPMQGLYIESILIPELYDFLLRRGYSTTPICPITLYKLWDKSSI